MNRTLLCSLAGGGAGFLVGFAVVSMAAGAQPASDTGAIIMFVGSFLAGTGAIAGAIMGGVESLKRRQQAREERQRESESDV